MGAEIINPERLRDKVAVVTGGNKGIGRAISHRFAQEGASDVFILSRSPADEVVADITSLGASGIWVPCDLTDETSLVHAVGSVRDSGKKVDILVNNAGITEAELGKQALLLGSSTREDFRAIMETNVISPYMLTRHFVKRDLFAHDEPWSTAVMGEADVIPSVIFMSSFLGIHWSALQEKYNASKAALIALAKSLTATVYQENGYYLRSNAVCPGFIVTSMTDSIPHRMRQIIAHSTPLKRFGTPEEVAGIVAHLSSDEGRFVTGMEYVIDGGLSGGISAAFPLYEEGVDIKRP